MKLTKGNWYKLKENGKTFVGQYLGRTDFECCVCGKGNHAHTFNIWYGSDYESWGYGKCHLPEMLEDLGQHDEPIIGE